LNHIDIESLNMIEACVSLSNKELIVDP